MSFAIHDPHRPAGKPAEASGLPQFNVHTVLIAVRCWWHIALPLGLLLASGAAVIVYYTTTPMFTAQAWLMIQAKPPIIMRELPLFDPQRFVQNQTEFLRSPMVLAPVASDPEVAQTPELANQLDPVKYLREKLVIKNQGGSDLFTIEFSSQSPDKAKLIVNKVAAEYRALQNAYENQLNEYTVKKLNDLMSNKQEEVVRLRSRLELLAKQNPAAGATPARKREEIEAAAAAHASLQSQLTQALVEQATNNATLQAATELLDKDSYEPSSSEVEAFVQSQPPVQDMKRAIEADRVKLEEHKQKSVNLKINTLYEPLAKRIKDAEALLEKKLAEMRLTGKEDLIKFAKNQRQSQLAQLQTKAKVLDVEVSVLADLLKEQQIERSEAAGTSLEFELARDDHDRARNLHEALATRLDHMVTEREAPPRVEIRNPAVQPLRPDEEIPYKNMGLLACAAFLVPFALAVGVELLFRRVSSRQQLEAGGRIAVVAEVTSLPARIRSQRRASGVIYRDRQLFEESIDGLRTYLSLVESTRGQKVLAVTSSISREGKTSLASQLAVSIASATGRPTLLIDGDMRSPDVHRIFDVDRGPGLSEVLQDQCPVEEAIETGFSDTLHLLTAGDLSVSPHRILGNNRFAELLHELGGMYEHIIIDTPPILAASEALLMASAADAAILCVRRDFSRLDQVGDAYSRLVTAGVKTAGAVLNGIPARHYAYRYGSYYYNRERAASDQADNAASETSSV